MPNETQQEWNKENTIQVKFVLHKVHDSDIIKKLSEVSNKQGYIKGLIRKDTGTHAASGDKRKEKLIDLTGQRFGSWTVIKRSDSVKKGITLWECQCDCGNIGCITSQSLRSGNSKGCRSCAWKKNAYLQSPRSDPDKQTSGVKTPAYKTWDAMKNRCNNPNNKSYPNYGGRGIKICDKWLTNYSAYYDYVSALPHYGEPGRTLDRINNEKGYEPGNVRWATRKEQAANKRKKI